MAFSVVLERLAAQATRVGAVGPALATLSGPLDRSQDAADDTEAAAAHAAAVHNWTVTLGRFGATCDDVAIALLAAMVCYEQADHFPAPAG